MLDNNVRDAFIVKDLFDVPHFGDAVLLGGASGLEGTISRVNVMEVPDVVDWVRPGEFLMTTGYPFKEDPGRLTTLIAQLAQKGVVALGIKTKRFLDEVPEAAIRAADHYGVPLIELPPVTTFSDVVREVMERVLVSESKDLSILQGRVQRLSHVLLHGDGLPAFLNHLQLMIQHPVVLLDPDNQWIASPAAEEWCAQIEPRQWNQLRIEPMAETQFLQANERNVRIHVSTVSDDHARSFLLLILEGTHDYGPADALTVTWAGRLLGFEISNMQARRTIEAKYFDQFLQDWISGRVVSSVDVSCGRKPVDGPCPGEQLMSRASCPSKARA
ncbi:PucR family transcriptional regulator ligand-binding domain-containing protein [Paenibacillus sp. JCM 10914]|uniref:PucR family transcriptional regulator ligand-binding domain-containing protein n=1 Tax=Paenibacillus sp. JCM 10914 TaxID=1236974 RepID=UPI0003CC907A|nr:PucR family transcriptional regulator ligand-binding domain-containing protein [Paenibacillus sp. JCM 10914]GAE05827.1 similar to Regulator of polyketide synthase expression [Paenibacillus sp. JCM 10914]